MCTVLTISLHTHTHTYIQMPTLSQRAAYNDVMLGLNALDRGQFTFQNRCYYHAAFFDPNHTAIPRDSPACGYAYMLPRSLARINLVPELCHPYRDRSIHAKDNPWTVQSCAGAYAAKQTFAFLSVLFLFAFYKQGRYDEYCQ